VVLDKILANVLQKEITKVLPLTISSLPSGINENRYVLNNILFKINVRLPY